MCLKLEGYVKFYYFWSKKANIYIHFTHHFEKLYEIFYPSCYCYIFFAIFFIL